MEKVYYSISEVATLLNLTPSNLRFWEKEFQQLKPKVTTGGTRRYTQKDIEIIRTIQYLLKDQHLTIEGAKVKLTSSSTEEMKNSKLLKKLTEIRKELIEIRRELNYNEALAEDTIVD